MSGMNHVRTSVFSSVVCLIGAVASAEDVSFSRDILPVLSDRCFHCHGPDEENREADLRLDLEASVRSDRGGYAVVVPGRPRASELWKRISSRDDGLVMPPRDSHRKPLSVREREAIRQWILDGAPWGRHWSFEKPVRPDIPGDQPNPIDAFVLERLRAEGLEFSPPAAPHTLLRRLSIDLTGMAPLPDEVSSFVRKPTEENWQTHINRLLKSPHYAERMAMWWLDAARYSDSDGYQQDRTRTNWPWRDWVIEQFRINRPFDEFTVEQFAGDLLPGATDEQRLATCFHRNHMTNGEGGRDPEESRIDYVIDRVNTMGTVWMGLTLGCAQCHAHKFDPVSQHDYYSLFAFFNSIDEDGRAGSQAKPYLKYQSPLVADRIAEMEAFVAECRDEETRQRQAAGQRFTERLRRLLASPPADYRVWWFPSPSVSSSDGTGFRVEPSQVIQTVGAQPAQDDYRITVPVPESMRRVTGWKLEVFPHGSHVGGRFSRNGNGEFTLTNVRLLARRKGSPTEIQLEMSGAVADVERNAEFKSDWDTRYGRIRDTLNDDARDGWSTIGVKAVEPHIGVFELAEPWTVQPGDQLVIVLRHRSTHGYANIGRFRIALAAERGETVRRTDGGSPVAELLNAVTALSRGASSNGGQVPDESELESLQRPMPGSPGLPIDRLDEALRRRLLDQFLLDDDAYQQASQRLVAASRQLSELKGQASARNVMVLAEREKPRDTHVLVRGVWDAKGAVVEPGVIPSVLSRPATETRTRLDLAHWLMDPDHPLTARVVVNHLWQLMFGQGLVRTPEDFGLQGERPTHPKLLDWLAVELVEQNWDLQHILRLIVTSRTYRQSSRLTADLRERDPENRLLARAPRFRMPAWMIRDNALRMSGLLNAAVGGPPVRPWQPQGVWSEITMGRFRYEPSVGPAQYRRTVYGFWRRSVVPTFLFDSAQRRVCEVRVRRTNTPLHALTLLNDTTMLEAARELADRMVAGTAGDELPEKRPVRETPLTFDRQLQRLSMVILSRELEDAERQRLQDIWRRTHAWYRDHVAEAVRYTTVGQQPPVPGDRAPVTAAWMTVASLLMNLDEAMSRE